MLGGLIPDRLREPAECIIRIGASGQEINALYPFISEVTVEATRDRASVATLKFETRRDENGKWLVQDAGILSPWEPIVIEASFGTYREEVMRGYIREIEADYPQDPGETAVTVKCQDESIVLDREHVRKVWGGDTPTSDQAIISSILASYYLLLDPESGSGQTGLVVSQDSTDITFLRRRAEANGYELIISRGSVYFGPMRLDATAQETIMVYAGPRTCCFQFAVKDNGHNPDKVGFDMATTQGAGTLSQVLEPDLPVLGNEPAASAGKGLKDFVWKLRRQGAMTQDELRARALRKANDFSLRVRAEGELDGALYGHVLRVGKPVGVDGVGERYGGIYYVDRVRHRFSLDGYGQTFTLLRNGYGDDLGTLSASGLSGVL